MPKVRVDCYALRSRCPADLIGSIVSCASLSQKTSKHATGDQGAAADDDVQEVPKPKGGNYNYDKNGRKELLFTEICGISTNPFLTNRVDTHNLPYACIG